MSVARTPVPSRRFASVRGPMPASISKTPAGDRRMAAFPAEPLQGRRFRGTLGSSVERERVHLKVTSLRRCEGVERRTRHQRPVNPLKRQRANAESERQQGTSLSVDGATPGGEAFRKASAALEGVNRVGCLPPKFGPTRRSAQAFCTNLSGAVCRQRLSERFLDVSGYVPAGSSPPYRSVLSTHGTPERILGPRSYGDYLLRLPSARCSTIIESISVLTTFRLKGASREKLVMIAGSAASFFAAASTPKRTFGVVPRVLHIFTSVARSGSRWPVT